MAALVRLLGWIVGLFTGSGAIYAFIKEAAKATGLKLVVLPIMIITLIALSLARFGLFYAVVKMLLWIYNELHAFFDMLPTILTGSGEYVSIAYEVLRAIGFIDAFSDVFSSFSMVLVALLLAFLARTFYKLCELTTNEIFKISMVIMA